jgi:hypothetical protein
MALTLADEIIRGNIDAVMSILQTRIDVNQHDEYGFTYLIEAAVANNFAIANMLIEVGAMVDLQDMTGGTALQWAAENNNLQLAGLLLDSGANPNAYNFAGQPVLVMPLMRRQQAMKELLIRRGADLTFAQDFINTKLLGHMFELVGTADLIDTRNNFVEVDFEGFFLEFTLGMITDSLSQFQNHFAARKLRHFDPYIKIILESLNRASRLIRFQQYQTNLAKHTDVIDRLIVQEPLLIPVGYEGHAITFIKLGNIFVKIDRREDSRLYDNIMLYMVKNPKNLTPSFLKNLIYEKNSDAFVNHDLPEILGLAPITELKVDAQISGNCSWANVEAVIPGMLFLLLLANPQSEKNAAQFKSQALDYFKRWREWNKDRALQYCIQSFKDNDSLRNACRAEILAAILFQRLRFENIADRERYEQILEVFREPQYAHVLKNYIQSYGYESGGKEGQEFLKNLRLAGYL